jgi:PEGA domain-containing protein
MTKARKVALIVAGLVLLVVFFVLPTMWAMRSIAVWWAYWRYVDEVSNLTGINHYLITAGGLLLSIPLWFGTSVAFSLGSRRRRYAGTAILIGLAVFYNLSLFWVTRETTFAFSGGAPHKWYALTPAGVRFYDRPGVDPTYGIPLKPVTPEVVRKLELLKQGEFKPADPTQMTFFNPITGEAQAWYYRYPDGAVEFYDKPGHHPLTGTALEPVTQQIVLEWRKTQRSQPQPSGSEKSHGPSGATPAPPPPKERHRVVAPGGTVAYVNVPPTSSGSVAAMVSVRSEPDAADAYLDWRPRGRTPTTFDRTGVSSLLVVVRDGYRAAFKRVESYSESEIRFALQLDVARSRQRLLLVASGGGSGDVVAALRGQLIEEGFSVLGAEEAREFQREVGRAGGLSNRVLRAWARSCFDTDVLLTARVQQSSRNLADQEFGYQDVKEAVKGGVRAEVEIVVEVTDLRSGDSIAAVSTKGSAFALDRAQGFQKATTQAATESAKLVRQKIQW